jgi:hypothetical protein
MDVVVLAEEEPKDAVTRTYLKIADCWRPAAVAFARSSNWKSSAFVSPRSIG